MSHALMTDDMVTQASEIIQDGAELKVPYRTTARECVEAILDAAVCQLSDRPSVLHRPKLTIDGNRYFVLYGEDIRTGVAGFGDTVAEAMADFDKQWSERRVLREPANG